MKPRLLIAEDHRLVVEGYLKILADDFELVGTAEDGQTLVKLAQSLRPDVILLDISLPTMNGFEAARQLRHCTPPPKIVFVTMHAEQDYVDEALRLGGTGYVLKHAAVAELKQAIWQALSGKVYVSPLKNAQSEDGEAKSVKFATDLSNRERQVLQLVAEGLAGKEISHALSISLKTVEFHKHSIMKKIGLYSTAELTRYAIRQGLVEA